MMESRASATAQGVAIRRAAHQLLDDPRVLDDPIAIRIIGKEDAGALRADPNRFERSCLSPYLRAFVAARSRYAEDELAMSVQRGVSQYVILGAGLDTFAYRNPYPAQDLHVFEVDHPATQTWKRARLHEAGIALPRNLSFAAVDFEKETLAEGLQEAGFEPGKYTFFSWLGVTEYLTTEAVMSMLRFTAEMPAGSGVVFDYMISPSLLTPKQRAGFDALAQRVASVGEPWRAFFDPGLLTAELSAMRFAPVKDCGPDEINARYFRNRSDGLRVGSLSRIMDAHVLNA